MAEQDARCLECGSPTARHKRWGYPLTYCSTKCRSNRNARLRRAKNAAERPDAPCPECGGVVERSSRGRPRRFCSDECKRRFNNRRVRRSLKPLRNQDPPPKLCAHCGKPFIPRNRQRIYCYGWCAQAAYHERRRNGVGPRMGDRTATCDECGSGFQAKHPLARWCSPACARRHWGRVRARQRVAPSEAGYSDLEIFERDGWICSLCGEPVDRAVSRSSLRGATIDHIFPLSLGGLDAPENVALAHNQCNRRKAALILPDE